MIYQIIFSCWFVFVFFFTWRCFHWFKDNGTKILGERIKDHESRILDSQWCEWVMGAPQFLFLLLKDIFYLLLSEFKSEKETQIVKPFYHLDNGAEWCLFLVLVFKQWIKIHVLSELDQKSSFGGLFCFGNISFISYGIFHLPFLILSEPLLFIGDLK